MTTSRDIRQDLARVHHLVQIVQGCTRLALVVQDLGTKLDTDASHCASISDLSSSNHHLGRLSLLRGKHGWHRMNALRVHYAHSDQTTAYVYP